MAEQREVTGSAWVQEARRAHDEGFAVLEMLAAIDEVDRGGPGDLRVDAQLLAPGPPLRRLRLTVLLGAGEELASLAGIWPAAAWHERAAGELSGLSIRPAGQDARRLILPEGYAGPPPLSKAFVLAARASTPWPGAPEPGETPGEAEGRVRRRASPLGVPPEWPS